MTGSENGVRKISLDATEMGRPLYESLGFKASDSCMVMDLEGDIDEDYRDHRK